jgi:putative membrane protein insertion efficiency factor
VSKVFIVLIRAYQFVLSPMLGQRCKYYPSCSNYAIEALRVHGVVRGAGLATWRVLRCNPFSDGGVDTVPPRRA